MVRFIWKPLAISCAAAVLLLLASVPLWAGELPLRDENAHSEATSVSVSPATILLTSDDLGPGWRSSQIFESTAECVVTRMLVWLETDDTSPEGLYAVWSMAAVLDSAESAAKQVELSRFPADRLVESQRVGDRSRLWVAGDGVVSLSTSVGNVWLEVNLDGDPDVMATEIAVELMARMIARLQQ